MTLPKKFYMLSGPNDISFSSSDDASSFRNKSEMLRKIQRCAEKIMTTGVIWSPDTEEITDVVQSMEEYYRENATYGVVLHCEVIGEEADFVNWNKIRKQLTKQLAAEKREFAKRTAKDREETERRVRNTERSAYRALYKKFKGVNPDTFEE